VNTIEEEEEVDIPVIQNEIKKLENEILSTKKKYVWLFETIRIFRKIVFFHCFIFGKVENPKN
jgi:hypothetical protein